MKSFVVQLLSCYASLEFALATPTGSTPKSTSYTANFDDLVPLSSAAIKPIGQYQGANYQNLAVAQLGVAGKSTPLGVKPNSGSNVAASDGTRAQLIGDPVSSVLTSTSTMDFKSCYLACALASQESAAGDGQSCSVTITGIKNGAANVAKTVSYVPSGHPASMMLVTLPAGFTGLQNVTFVTNPSLQIAILLDTLIYVIHS